MSAAEGLRSRGGYKRLNRAYISLGSNIEPERHLPIAVALLAEYGNVPCISTVWESTPVGFTHQPNYLNAALILETMLSAHDLCHNAINQIEKVLGRTREAGNKDAPRQIDIDIMLFNHDILQLATRRIPDPELLSRPFVAIPLAEIDASYIHPETGQSLRDIAEALSTSDSDMKKRPDVKLSTVTHNNRKGSI